MVMKKFDKHKKITASMQRFVALMKPLQHLQVARKLRIARQMFSTIGWIFSAIGWIFSTIGWIFNAIGWIFSAIGWIFSAIGWKSFQFHTHREIISKCSSVEKVASLTMHDDKRNFTNAGC